MIFLTFGYHERFKRRCKQTRKLTFAPAHRSGSNLSSIRTRTPLICSPWLNTHGPPHGNREMAPNPSFEARPNGTALGPRSTLVHDAPRGPSAIPSVPPQLE